MSSGHYMMILSPVADLNRGEVQGSVDAEVALCVLGPHKQVVETHERVLCIVASKAR
jgi:hypothetical protein